MQAITRKFWDVEGPTWILAVAIYGAWPTIPWYELPRFYRENRAKLLKHNDNFVFRGYWEITRQYPFRPVFVPVHPTV